MSEISIFLDLLKEYGIEVVMLLWFMFRTEKVIEANTKALQSLGDVLNKAEDTE